MGRSGETTPSRGFWKLIFSAVALLCTLPLVAQKAQEPSPPKYDGATSFSLFLHHPLHSPPRAKSTLRSPFNFPMLLRFPF